METKTKTLVQSKEVWVLSLTFVLAVLSLPEFISVLPESWLPAIALTGSMLTLILRIFFTQSKIDRIM